MLQRGHGPEARVHASVPVSVGACVNPGNVNRGQHPSGEHRKEG